ncbi:unnamed protein product [Clonostachys chloroleuca]|uniref:Uncharacterized protein n=1 Tax=Clonostachys chloroleuca TaxID=1926264 RepID=A0AA35Q1V4_9HYPO|nr:unnamed protein product [Clonostachys chloroleuca]
MSAVVTDDVVIFEECVQDDQSMSQSLLIEIIKTLEYGGQRFVIRPGNLLQASAANANEPIWAFAYELEIGMH